MTLLGTQRIGAALLALAAATASAQTYPDKAIRIVVPYPPGGGADITARPIAQKLNQLWGVPVVVDHRGGASGMIGADIVAKAPPDGYTLMVSASAEVALNVAIFPHMPYDPVADFEPVGLVGSSPTLMVTHPEKGAPTCIRLSPG